MKKSVLVLAFVLGALGGGCFAQSDQPSLAELAKQKKPAKKAVLKLSDEDSPPPSEMPTHSKDDVRTSASGAAVKPSDKAENTSKKDKSTADAPVNSDKKTSELKEKLASYQKEEQVWKDSMKHYEELIANEPSEFRRQMYQDALDNDRHNAALYHQKAEEIQNELAKPQVKPQAGGSH